MSCSQVLCLACITVSPGGAPGSAYTLRCGFAPATIPRFISSSGNGVPSSACLHPQPVFSSGASARHMHHVGGRSMPPGLQPRTRRQRAHKRLAHWQARAAAGRMRCKTMRKRKQMTGGMQLPGLVLRLLVGERSARRRQAALPPEPFAGCRRPTFWKMVSGSRIAADRNSGPLGTVKSICLHRDRIGRQTQTGSRSVDRPILSFLVRRPDLWPLCQQLSQRSTSPQYRKCPF